MTRSRTAPRGAAPSRRAPLRARPTLETLDDRTTPVILGSDLSFLLGLTPPPAPAPVMTSGPGGPLAPAAPGAPAPAFGSVGGAVPGVTPPAGGGGGVANPPAVTPTPTPTPGTPPQPLPPPFIFPEAEEVCVPAPVPQPCVEDASRLTYSFEVNGRKVPALAGNVQQGDTVKVTFTVSAGAPVKVSLVSYAAPKPVFDATVADQQFVFDAESACLGQGTYSFDVTVPDSFFQVDFVVGDVIPQLGQQLYATRLIAFANGGVNPFQGAVVTDSSRLADVFYTVDGRRVDTLRGNVTAGSVVEAHFTVTDGPPVKVSLVSYAAPKPVFDATVADQQRVYSADTDTFGPGRHVLRVDVPPGFFQVDFVEGDVIPILGQQLYADRLIDLDNGGVAPGECLPARPHAYAAVGAGAGWAPVVYVYDVTANAPRALIAAYDPSFTGGVRVATGDVNGDGVLDIIVVPGAGGGPHVKVYNGVDFSLMMSFQAYDAIFTAGLYVAAGDVNGDGYADIITGAGAGGGPHVKVFDGRTGAEIRSFFAYNMMFSGGVRVAAGDFDGDGVAEIVTAAGEGGGPHVQVFRASDLALIKSFFAYDPAFAGGVSVAAGDLDGDGVDELFAGAGAGWSPQVKVFRGGDFEQTDGFDAYLAAFAGGVEVGVVRHPDRDGLLTGAGPGGGSHLKVFFGGEGADVSTLAFDPSFLGGVFVGT